MLWRGVRSYSQICETYSEPPGCEDSPGGIQNTPYLYKKLSKSRFSDPFFWRFLVISGLGSQIYIVKSAILSFWVFLSTFLHEITLKAIDIDNIGCLEPFLPLWEHFWNRVSMELNCASDLTPRLNMVFKILLAMLILVVFLGPFPSLFILHFWHHI